MASSARQAIRSGYSETSGTIARMVPTLLLTCMTTIVLGGTDDRVLLSGGEVETPLVGETRFEIFMIVAPGIIVVMRIFIELQLAHLSRLSRIMREHNVRRPVRLGGDNNMALALAGLVAIHILPVGTLGFLARQVSAVYVDMALALYAVAIALALLSGWSLYERTNPMRKVLAVLLPPVLLVGGGTLLSNQFVERDGAFGKRYICGVENRGVWGLFAHTFYRSLDLEQQPFPKQKAQQKHMVCGNLNNSDWQNADMREAKLTGADMRSANLHSAQLGGAVFENAVLRGAILASANTYESWFHGADLSRADLSEAELSHTRFVEGVLRSTVFEGAKINHSTFWMADIDAARFENAEINFSKFFEAFVYEVSFSGSEMREVDFFKAQLEFVSFSDATLDQVGFEDATLLCVDFAGATIVNISFLGVDPEDLRTVRIDAAALPRPTATPTPTQNTTGQPDVILEAPRIARDTTLTTQVVLPDGVDISTIGADFDTTCPTPLIEKDP